MSERHELNYERVTADGEPVAWLYVLHGIFGAGRNWASVTRRVLKERPEWGALLIDLRQHGRSQGFPPPHTVEAAAADLGELAARIDTPPDAVLGHSFGGKVGLLFAGGAGGGAAVSTLRQVWVVDSTPAVREPAGSAWTMLELVQSMRGPFANRDVVIDRIAAAGFARPIAQWMATNLEAADGGYDWRFDPDAMEQLLRSFFRADAWSVVEAPPAGVEVHLVKAEESSVLDGDDLARAEAAAAHGRTFLHRIAGGHWVNADNPDAIERLLVQNLPRP